MKYLVEAYAIFRPTMSKNRDWQKYGILGSGKGFAREFIEGELFEGKVEFVVKAKNRKIAASNVEEYLKSDEDTKLVLINKVSTLPKNFKWEAWL